MRYNHSVNWEAQMRLTRFLFFLAGFAVVGCPMAQGADNSPFLTIFRSLDKNFWYVSSGWANGTYQSCEWRAEDVAILNNNLQLTISNNGGAVRPIGCAEIRTNARPGYGLYEARMRV